MSSIAQHELHLQDERKNDMEIVTKEYIEREYTLACQDYALARNDDQRHEALRTMARLYNIAASAHGFEFADSMTDRKKETPEEAKKAGDHVDLPDGSYHFRVVRMKRGRFPGNDRMSACHMVKLLLAVEDPASKQEEFLTDVLYLNSKMECRLIAFLASIGQKKPGEICRVSWDRIEGSTGKLEIEAGCVKAYLAP